MLPTRASLITVIALTLAACGGGGGGPSSPSGGAASTGTPATAATTLTESVNQEFEWGPGLTAPTTTFPGSFTVTTDASGSITSIAIPAASGGTVTLTPDSSAPALFPGGEIFTGVDSGHISYSLQTMGAATGLSYSDFGEWGNSAGNNFYAGGSAPTPASALPPLGSNITATYNGQWIAIFSGTGGAGTLSGPSSGSMSINANFSNGSIGASYGGILAGTVTTANVLNSGGTYTMTNRGNSNAGASNPAGPITINASGSFFGPSTMSHAPPETTGLLSGTVGSVPFGGSFGAKR